MTLILLNVYFVIFICSPFQAEKKSDFVILLLNVSILAGGGNKTTVKPNA